ncbi:MAG: metallophosphoesterase family protein, partial [Sphingomonadales bacterium]
MGPERAAMKIGIVSDIHGNHQALKRAIDLMGPVDRLVSLGDNIDQFRFSNDVVRILRDHDVLTLTGNHEAVFFSPLGFRARQPSWIDRDLVTWLGTRPGHCTFTAGGRTVLMVHATPWTSDWDYVYPHSPDFRRFGSVDADIVLYGHTHCPVVRDVTGTL